MTSAASAMTARGLSPWPATRAAPPRPPRGIAPVSSGGGGVPRALSRRAASGAASGDASPALPPRGTNALQEDADGAPHVSVLMRQVLECFEGRALRHYVDGTMGAGGHASAVVRAHPEMRAFVGFDVDPLAHAIARPRLEAAAEDARRAAHADASTSASPVIHTVSANFRDLRERLLDLDVPSVDGILLDLGVSSMHLDLPERGFSFNDDGPLDMRMGPAASVTAEEVVNDWPEEEIARVLRDYGEEKHWRLLARRICERRADAPITTTRQLVAALGRVPGAKGGRSGNVHPATRTFQGIRIAVNDELGAVEDAIPAAIESLAPGGRLAIISFHSLEDRIVKEAFRRAAGRTPPTDRPFSAWEPQPEAPPKIVKLVTRKPIVADADEVKANVRSRSAKLRICEKL